MSGLSLYYHTQLETTIFLLPEQIDGDIEDHILENLKDSIENNVSEYNGIVHRVYRIVSHDLGMIDKSNFMGTISYNVVFDCLFCSPAKDLEFICVVDNIFKGCIIGHNGSVIVAIQINIIDKTKFNTTDISVQHIKTNKKIESGQYIKISVNGFRIDRDKNKIFVEAKLLDIASDQDISKFLEEQKLLVSDQTNDTKDFY